MGLFEQFSYTNFHEMNLDWILQQMRNLGIEFSKLKADIIENLEPLVEEAVSQGLIDVIYDSSTNTITLTGGPGVSSGDLVSFFTIGNNRIEVSDQTARDDAAAARRISRIGQNRIGGYEVALTPYLYDDSPTGTYPAGTIQGATSDGDYVYVVETGVFPACDIRVYGARNHNLIRTISNVLGYHGNDLCVIGNKLYIAQTYSLADSTPSKNITVYDMQTGVTSYITAFSNIGTGPLWGVAAFDNDTLIVAIGPSPNGEHFWKYVISTGEIIPLTTIGEGRVPYTASQNIDYYNGSIYMTVVGSSMIMRFEVYDNTAELMKIYRLPEKDPLGVKTGEYEAVAFTNNPFPGDMMIISMTSNSDGEDYTLNMYGANLAINTARLNPAYNVHDPQTSPGDVYCDSTYTGLYEDGTVTHPFKSLGRAMAAATTRGAMYLKMAAGSYTTRGVYGVHVNLDLQGDVIIESASNLYFGGCWLHSRNNGHTLTLKSASPGGVTFYQSDVNLEKVVFDVGSYSVTIQRSRAWLNGATNNSTSAAPFQIEGGEAMIDFTSMPNKQGATDIWAQVSGNGVLWYSRYAGTHINTPGDRWWVNRMGAAV